MSVMASQITSLTIVYSTIYSGADQRKHQSSASLAFVRGNSPVNGEFPEQMASDAENVSILWCYHEIYMIFKSQAQLGIFNLHPWSLAIYVMTATFLLKNNPQRHRRFFHESTFVVVQRNIIVKILTEL